MKTNSAEITWLMVMFIWLRLHWYSHFQAKVAPLAVARSTAVSYTGNN